MRQYFRSLLEKFKETYLGKVFLVRPFDVSTTTENDRNLNKASYLVLVVFFYLLIDGCLGVLSTPVVGPDQLNKYSGKLVDVHVHLRGPASFIIMTNDNKTVKFDGLTKSGVKALKKNIGKSIYVWGQYERSLTGGEHQAVQIVIENQFVYDYGKTRGNYEFLRSMTVGYLVLIGTGVFLIIIRLFKKYG